MPRIGLGLDCKLPIDALSKMARRAEQDGYNAIWAVQYYYFHDPYLVLSAASHVTSHIKLGTSVANIYDRFPLTTATLAASLQEMSRGRFTLGIGSSVSTKIEDEMGIPYKRPLKALEESVKVIRQFLAGMPVSFNGDVLRINGSQIGLKVPEAHIPIYLAAVGPKALKLATVVADGVILNYGTNLGYIADAVSKILTYSEGDSSGFEVASLVWFLPDFSDEMKKAAKQTLAAFFSYPGFGESVLTHVDRSGEILRKIRNYYYLPAGRKNLESAASLISDEILQLSMIVGKDQIAERIREYNKVGVSHVILMPYGGLKSLQRLLDGFDASTLTERN